MINGGGEEDGLFERFCCSTQTKKRSARFGRHRFGGGGVHVGSSIVGAGVSVLLLYISPGTILINRSGVKGARGEGIFLWQKFYARRGKWMIT